MAKNIKSTQPQNLTTESSTNFLAVGDISLSRGVALAIDQSKDPSLPFKSMEALLKSTDFNIGNLETPFSSSDRYTASETLVFNAPKKNIDGLVNYNFQFLSLANNHALDQGLDGIKTTRDWLFKHNIFFTGTGENLEEAWTPAVIEKNGVRTGFVSASYASINDGGKTTNSYVARIEDTERLKKALEDLTYFADFKVVLMHAGTEYTTTPTKAQKDFAHAAIDAGADIVIGHHPHWVQDKEVYCPVNKNSRTVPASEVLQLTAEETDQGCKAIYYSLGNFVFDQQWSEQTKKGLALKITLTKQQTASLQPANSPIPTPRVQIEEIPIYIESNCCPTINQAY